MLLRYIPYINISNAVVEYISLLNIKYPFSNTECLNPVSISLPSCVIAIESVITIINIIDFFINLKYGINLFICIPPFSKMYKHILKIHSF